MERKVLLVEDDSDTREIYRTILEEHGYRVLEAATGEEGLRLAREGDPDLILMNIAIPHIDGWEATVLLKDDPRTAHIPVIAITAFTRLQDARRAHAVGCSAYLPKPCDPSRLLAEVHRFIGPDLRGEPQHPGGETMRM
jgi:CheY-like chemotaxis protein